MKRKLILSGFMVLFCTGVIFLMKGVQEQAAVIPPSAESTVELSAGNPEAGPVAGTAGTGAAAETAVSASKPVGSNNFQVYDSVRGIYLTSLSVEFSQGDSVAAATMKALEGNFRASGSGDSIYFSRILGVAEKSAGPLSGWNYYVNGQKPSVSAGAYHLKEGDVILWKFLEDGVN